MSSLVFLYEIFFCSMFYPLHPPVMFRDMISFYSFLLHLPVLVTYFWCLIEAQPYEYPTAALSTQWKNTASDNHSVIVYRDGTTIRTVLRRNSSDDDGPRYACGFYCNGTCTEYMFAIYIVYGESGSSPLYYGFPQVVWSANRNSPVKINSTLELQEDGNLVLKEVDGKIVWSTNTQGKSVVGLNLTQEGNLVLYNKNNAPVWQSFDHPTDSLVPRQRLFVGQKLTASVSSTNWTELPLLSFNFTSEGLFGLMATDPPQFYYYNRFSSSLLDGHDTFYIEYINGSLALVFHSQFYRPVIEFPLATSPQYIKLGSDGHLRVYEWSIYREWTEVADLLTESLGDCAYPLVCGEYGICSNGQCSCPTSSNTTTYFRPVSEKNPNFGCAAVTALSCGPTVVQSFVELSDVYYFPTQYDDYAANLKSNDSESCKQSCAKNCSCKAAIFAYGSNSSQGSCYLLSQVFSLMNNIQDMTQRNSTAYIKVQNVSSELRVPHTSSGPSVLPFILGSSFGTVFVMVLVVIGYLVWRRKHADEAEEDYLDQVPGMPTRFGYEDLKTATQNFSKKLGAGGFGSVYEGTHEGTKIAVKQLEGLGRIKDSFLAEVESIGSIHHVNLVRLMGFCAEKAHRLLVYEYMANGSLDRWIYQKKNQGVLEWRQRKKIIVDIAKGLNYLHEDCRQKIIHLDIKPQNILLDENFNAKVSDFGLSKLIDRDQSQVVTTMRGTPGYLAPDWLSAVITEKVDVYSFGVVILETVCGRRVFDNSLDEDDKHLLGVFKRKAEEERLADIVDKSSEDMQLNQAEAMEMMRLAAWCLQGDCAKRPSMPMVIKVLEGVSGVPVDLDYNFFDRRSTWPKGGGRDGGFREVTPLLPSVLSGPR